MLLFAIEMMRKLLILRNAQGGEKQANMVRESVFIREIRRCFFLPWFWEKQIPPLGLRSSVRITAFE
jgi:hypothetical protein